jgi:hypothetical protein
MNDMVDMSQFVEAKSDQLNADDLMGRTLTITVTRVTGSDSSEQPVIIHYEGDNGKPFKPCKTMRRVLLGVWGKHASEYVGRSMTLYRDDSVSFGGLQTGGTRISHMSHIDSEKVVVVNKTRGKKAGIKIKPLVIEQRQASAPKSDDLGAWARKFINSLGKAPSLDKLNAYATQSQGKLDALELEIPEAHEACMAALNDKRASFADDDGDPFADAPDAADAGDAADSDGGE